MSQLDKKHGMLPEGWVWKEFGEILTFKNGVNASKSSYGKGVRFINVMEVLNNEYITADIIPGSVAISEQQKKDFLVTRGDILFNRTSETTTEVGLAAVYLDDNEAVFGGFVIRGQEINKGSIDDNFKKFCFRSTKIREQMIKGGQGAVRSNIGQGDLEKITIPLPPIHEQRAIAHLLSLQDRSIQTTQALIEQKELRKKWLMQQLLTGKKRLSGFGEAWKEVRLGEAGVFIPTNSLSREKLSYTEGSVKNIHYGDIHTKFKTHFVLNNERVPCIVSENSSTFDTKSICKIGDLILADASEDTNDVGKTIEIIDTDQKNIVAGLHTIHFRPNSGHFSIGYGGYLFNCPLLKEQIQKVTQGSKVYSISPTLLKLMYLLLPSVEEQSAIVSILQSADRELELLRKSLEQRRVMKKWLMQVLLTGRVRLV